MPTPGYNFQPNDSVTADKLNLSVSGLTFTDGTISGGALQNLTVTRAKISDAAIDNAKVASNTLTPDRLVKAVAVAPATNLDGQLLISGLDGVFAAKSLSGGISVAASGAVTLGEKIIQDTHLADNAVTSRIIKAGAVQSHHLNTLLHDTSLSAGAYAATLEGVTLFQGLELKLLILRANSSNSGKATLSFNNGDFYKILKPGGYEFAAYELAGGSILNIVWTGGAWQVVSPWAPLVVEESVLESTQEFRIPATAARLRIRAWARGGDGVYTYRVMPGESGGSVIRAGGGGGAFAEWSGPVGTGGLLVANQLLAITVSPTQTKITEQVDPTKVLLHCGGGSVGRLDVPYQQLGQVVFTNPAGGVGGTFDASSLLATNSVTRGALVSVNGGVGGTERRYSTGFYSGVLAEAASFLGGYGSNGGASGGSIGVPGFFGTGINSVTATSAPGAGRVIIEVTYPPPVVTP